MRDRILNILRHLISREGMLAPLSYEGDSNSFEIGTSYSHFGHKTFINFDMTEELLRTSVAHFFGYLDTENGINAEQLLQLLMYNKPSFQNSSGYLAVSPIEGGFLVSLHSSPLLLLKWDDKDIAEVLYATLFDLVINGLAFEPPAPIIMIGK